MTTTEHADKCVVCKAPPKAPCTSLIDGGPLPDREFHEGRTVKVHPTVPEWAATSTTKYTRTVEDGVLIVRFPGGSVKYRSDCKTCVRYGSGDTDFWPDHDAMAGCRSGRHSHCTCDGCF